MMAKKEKKEVTFTEGSVFQALIRFAIPVLGALVLQAAYGAVDLLVGDSLVMLPVFLL